MKHIVQILIIILLLIIIGYYFYKFLKTEKFVATNSFTNVIFLSKEDTKRFIIDDPDFYVRSLSPLDLYARKAKLEEDYRYNSSNSALDFTDEQKSRFSSAAKKADDYFKNSKFTAIDCTKIVQIPWKIALTEGEVYENGLPHTRGDIIFISSALNETEQTLVTTLIHEKVHLYQRANPNEMMSYLENQGFLRWKQRLGEPRIRANPDLDAWIYINSKTKKPMAAYYVSDQPHNITDVTLTDAAYEHPYELMAYRIANG